MKNKTGPPVEGDDFYGREKEINYVWKRIEDGNNIILPSPRRVGKSSFAKKMLAIAESKGWETLEINLEKVRTELDFVKLFVKELKKLSWWETTKDKGKDLLEIVKSLKPGISASGVTVTLDWQSKRTDVYRELESLLNHKKDTLFYFDELTILLNGIVRQENGKQNVESFLHWLRSLRLESGTQIRWIFCSSIGIDNFTFSHKLSDTNNDIQPYRLKSFDYPTSIGLIRALEKGAGIEFTDSIRDAIVEKLRFCLPYFIQVIFEKMTALITIDDQPVNEELVDQAYAAIISESYLNTWIERLREQYSGMEGDAFLLLKHMCQQKEGVTRNNLLNLLKAKYQDDEKAESASSTVIYMLENDGYLMEEDGRYHFRSPLIRDFWYKRHVK
ncbi:MAG: hypothetical protein AAFZ15_17550 [Bacteroidota bacterium]